MEIVLVHGLWLDGSSWDAVAPHLEGAGHRTRPLTLPNEAGTTPAERVAAVVSAIDDAEGPVLVVGHSAGCGIAHAAVDSRPDRVARAVHVGGFPSPSGEPLLTGLPSRDGVVPMPDWREMGEEANVVDLDEAALARLYAEAIPEPESALTTPLALHDERRFAVPATMVCPEYTSTDLKGWVDSGEEAVSEIARSAEVTYVDLPGGHWPQLTQPEALAKVILEAAG